MRWSRPSARSAPWSSPSLYPDLPREPALTVLWRFWKSPSSFLIWRIAYARSWTSPGQGRVTARRDPREFRPDQKREGGKPCGEADQRAEPLVRGAEDSPK